MAAFLDVIAAKTSPSIRQTVYENALVCSLVRRLRKSMSHPSRLKATGFLIAASLMSSFGAVQSRAQSASLQTIPSMPLSTFQSSLGVNIHIEYTDGLYANEAQVLKDLQFIGIHNVRDYIPSPSWLPAGQALGNLETLAASGIHFDFIGNCNAALGPQITQLDQLIAAYPGIAISVEGANEINNFPCQLGSGTNEQNAEAFQKQLYSTVQSDSHFAQDFPVLYMTGAAPVDLQTQLGFANFANMHPYPNNAVQPFATLQDEFPSYYTGYTQADPHQITETGYATIPDSSDPSGVDEPAQAEMILNLFFDAALQGNTHTYVYQLLEDYSNYATDSDTAYGMFHYTDGSPKIIAQALANMLAIFPADKASDGSIALFMWNEQPVWNQSSDNLIYVTPQYVQVKMPGNWNVSYFTPADITPINDTEIQGQYYSILSSYPTALIFRKQ
jgi:hypothetical protein